jgi:hypothetical protein
VNEIINYIINKTSHKEDCICKETLKWFVNLIITCKK